MVESVEKRFVDFLPDVENPAHDITDYHTLFVSEVGKQVEQIGSERSDSEIVSPPVTDLTEVAGIRDVDGKVRRNITVTKPLRSLLGRFHVYVPARHLHHLLLDRVTQT